jgi:enoyl-CoA hydratase/carnithine racemase
VWSVSLVVERRGPVGWVTFNRPSAGNAMDAAMIEALPEAWRQHQEDPEVHALAVTGAGKAFQTGLDVLQLSRDPDALRKTSRQTRDNSLRLTAVHCGVDKPVIAAVNGVCAGGGLHFVVDADLVIASTQATFLDPHVSLGQTSALEGIGLARRASFGQVARMALTGVHERVDAERARQLGWVAEVVEPEDLLESAQRVGEFIAREPTDGLRLRKGALWHALEVGLTPARGETRRQWPHRRDGSE